jgi:hypothetical protein
MTTIENISISSNQLIINYKGGSPGPAPAPGPAPTTTIR